MNLIRYIFLLLFSKIEGTECEKNGLQQGSTCENFAQCVDGALLQELKCPRLTPRL